MTKKEIAIFKELQDKALGEYMKHVMSHTDAPVAVIERACVFSELDHLFFPDKYAKYDDIEAGA